MGIYPELENLDLASSIDYWYGEPLEGQLYAALYYGEVACLILNQGTAGRLFLMEQINQSDNDRLSAILFHLPSKENPLSLNIILKYLNNESSQVVASAIEGLIRQEAKKAKNEILTLRFYDCPYVRSSVLRFMSKLYPKEARSLLLESLQDSHYIVRESAIDEIDELDLVEAIAALRPLLNDSSLDVRQAAETAIKNLASSVENYL